jgi:oligopeptide/dipeptide ABC transporter ATP-binding protein
MPEPLLIVDNVSKSYGAHGGLAARSTRVKAVSEVTFTAATGETLGIVGESGCGKSTLGRLIAGLLKPDSGTINFNAPQRRANAFQGGRVQMVFQDPLASLNPRMTVGQALSEPLRVHRLADRRQAQSEVTRLLEQVGLSDDYANRYPADLSGGQCQRVGIARALSVRPDLIVADEAVSALDVSIRAQILNLFLELRRTLDLSLIFISHDLSVVRHVSDWIAVMYLGRVVEYGSADDVFDNPQHPYTQALIRSAPVPDPRVRTDVEVLKGEPPSPVDLPEGCAFRSRCPIARPECVKPPASRYVAPRHWADCHAIACERPDTLLACAVSLPHDSSKGA